MVHFNITWGAVELYIRLQDLKEARVVSRTEQEYEPPYHYVLCLVSCFRDLRRVRDLAKYEAGHNACIYPYNVDTSEPDKVVNLIDPRVGQC